VLQLREGFGDMHVLSFHLVVLYFGLHFLPSYFALLYLRTVLLRSGLLLRGVRGRRGREEDDQIPLHLLPVDRPRHRARCRQGGAWP